MHKTVYHLKRGRLVATMRGFDSRESVNAYIGNYRITSEAYIYESARGGWCIDFTVPPAKVAKLVKRMESERLARGRHEYPRWRITRTRFCTFIRTPGGRYTLTAESCTCTDWCEYMRHLGGRCKHLLTLAETGQLPESESPESRTARLMRSRERDFC